MGECELPIRQGLFHREDIAGEMGELIAGLLPGRTDEGQITVFDSTGIALQDLVVSAVNEALRQAGDAMEKGMSGLTGGLDLSAFGL